MFVVRVSLFLFDVARFDALSCYGAAIDVLSR